MERGEPDPEIDQQSVILRIWMMYLTIPHGGGGCGKGGVSYAAAAGVGTPILVHGTEVLW